MGNARKTGAEYVQSLLGELEDQIIEKLVEDGEAPDDVNNDYDNGDQLFHEICTDHEYSLREAADILDELSEYEETDSGLWDGLEPRKAVEAQAAYTMAGYCYRLFCDSIKNINRAYAADVGEIEGQYEDDDDNLLVAKRVLAENCVRDEIK